MVQGKLQDLRIGIAFGHCVPETVAQQRLASGDSGHDGANGNFEGLGDFAVGQLLEVEQEQRRPKGFLHGMQGLDHGSTIQPAPDLWLLCGKFHFGGIEIGLWMARLVTSHAQELPV